MDYGHFWYWQLLFNRLLHVFFVPYWQVAIVCYLITYALIALIAMSAPLSRPAAAAAVPAATACTLRVSLSRCEWNYIRCRWDKHCLVSACLLSFKFAQKTNKQKFKRLMTCSRNLCWRNPHLSHVFNAPVICSFVWAAKGSRLQRRRKHNCCSILASSLPNWHCDIAACRNLLLFVHTVQYMWNTNLFLNVFIFWVLNHQQA